MKRRLVIAALFAVPLLWLFGRALVTDQMFVFRDAAHYYYPYYHYVAEQWGQGQTPLWNPLENTGQPLLADATAAVLYPGKLIFAFPLGYDTNYKLYIVGHVLFAAITAFIAARGFAASKYAAVVCAISYAFSGSVLFQYCNVIFLVGASWLPLAVLATDRMLRQRDWRWVAALAVVLAMMVLGGDPQLAYHVGIVATVYALLLWKGDRRDASQVERPVHERVDFLHHRFVLLLSASSFAFALAAVQVLPSLEWTRHTKRAATDVPRNVVELAKGVGNEQKLSLSHRCAFLLGQQENDHHLDSYQFSVGPWHLAGYVWPNLFGNLFPANTRWIRALPAEGRMWTPTLYMGLLPMLLALSQFRLHGRARLLPSLIPQTARREPRPPESDHGEKNTCRIAQRTWFTWMTLFALLASFGWYGLGWILIEIDHAIRGADAPELPIGSPWGGIYWFMQSVLPGYILFRYPAKWLVIVAMGLSLLAAFGWDAMVQQSTRFVRRGLLVVLGVTMVTSVAVHMLIFVFPVWEQLGDYAPSDALFGPLDLHTAGWGVVATLIHTLLLTTLLLWLIPDRRVGQITSEHSFLLLLLIVLDLCLAQRGLVPTNQMESSPIGRELAQHDPFDDERRDAQAPPTRTYRQTEAPPVGNFAVPNRQAHGQYWDQLMLVPKYHLLHQIDMLDSPSAPTSQDFRELMHLARRRGVRAGDLGWPNIALLEQTSTEYVLANDDDPLHRLYPSANFRKHGMAAQVYAVPHQHRARVVYNVIQIPELRGNSPTSVYQRTVEVFKAIQRDATVAVVETDEELPFTSLTSAAKSKPCQILVYKPTRVDIWASPDQDGVVVLADAFAPGWICEVTNLVTGEKRYEPILRTNRIMRGVWLPAGEYELSFRYQPRSFQIGLVVSFLAWVGLLAWVGWFFIRQRQNISRCIRGRSYFCDHA